ncbi:hypothetical protein BDQ12DRAFT_669255 [Crucibulum laeve]|uniref:Uncharacterized protein n=1 Tax=Crucibulum laeve TaxID=68775 RepID=A0A5C3LQ05_9AGAR|nr:hypothetical protein BDQ12DRAFT_669255 [Crucibulum laeve]
MLSFLALIPFLCVALGAFAAPLKPRPLPPYSLDPALFHGDGHFVNSGRSAPPSIIIGGSQPPHYVNSPPKWPTDQQHAPTRMVPGRAIMSRASPVSGCHNKPDGTCDPFLAPYGPGPVHLPSPSAPSLISHSPNRRNVKDTAKPSIKCLKNTEGECTTLGGSLSADPVQLPPNTPRPMTGATSTTPVSHGLTGLFGPGPVQLPPTELSPRDTKDAASSNPEPVARLSPGPVQLTPWYPSSRAMDTTPGSGIFGGLFGPGPVQLPPSDFPSVTSTSPSPRDEESLPSSDVRCKKNDDGECEVLTPGTLNLPPGGVASVGTDPATTLPSSPPATAPPPRGEPLEGSTSSTSGGSADGASVAPCWHKNFEGACSPFGGGFGPGPVIPAGGIQ